MTDAFEKSKKNFGFGCMRLPLIDGEVDTVQFSQMIDEFMAAGFNYYDTAHGYLDGKSEKALRECLVTRYPRESYVLTNKLSSGFFEKQEDIRPLFSEQLRCCGVEYFDFYLMHAQSAQFFEKYRACRAYETALELKEEGKIRHFGISFHDHSQVLDQILTEYPQIETVQIQFNYVDYEDPAIESRNCYDVCRKHGKPILVMEPVKGGSLAQLPADAASIYGELKGGSPASYAIRFAAGFPGIRMVLSGMSDLAQLRDNLSFMKDFQPLDEREQAAVQKVRALFLSKNLISCTGCRYCTAGCPKKIAIPDLFACMNTKTQYHNRNASYYYHSVHTVNGGKASDCIKCGKCEKVCPQHLEIRRLLEEVAAEFE